jgi:hypothetical protein
MSEIEPWLIAVQVVAGVIPVIHSTDLFSTACSATVGLTQWVPGSFFFGSKEAGA